MLGHRKVRRAAAAALTTGALLATAGAAQAQRPPSMGEGAPVGQSGIQLYNFRDYLSGGVGGDPVSGRRRQPATPYCMPTLPANTVTARMERLFAFLQAHGIKNVELYGYPGQPVPERRAARRATCRACMDLRALGDKYGIRFPARHGSLSESQLGRGDRAREDPRPGPRSARAAPAAPAASAATRRRWRPRTQLNKLGKRSVEAGVGPAYFHNHNSRVQHALHRQRRAQERVGDRDGAHRPALGRRRRSTSAGPSAAPRVTRRRPIRRVGAAYVNRMIQKFGRRVDLVPRQGHGRGRHPPGLRRRRPAHARPGRHQLRADVRVGQEQDASTTSPSATRSRSAAPTNFNPFTNAADGANALQARPRAVAEGQPEVLPVGAQGHAGGRQPGADHRSPTTVTRRW